MAKRLRLRTSRGVVPGAEISKIVTVDNTGDNAAYVRIKVVKEITSENEPEGEFDPSLIGLDLDVENWDRKGWILLLQHAA